jgi:iron(III) transport system substrate-binding protein
MPGRAYQAPEGKLLGRLYFMFETKVPAQRALRAATAIALLSCIASGAAFAKTKPQEVVVYTALQPEQLPVYEQAFDAAYPQYKIKWVHDTSAAITQRLIAEKGSPQADVIWGLDASYLMQVDKAGGLDHYRPNGFEKIKDDFKDRRTGWPTWVGMDAWANAICFNTKMAKKLNLPKPEAWKDLMNPVYKGQIVMPDPSDSDTGYLTVSGWLQTFGDGGAFDYMDLMNANVGTYLHAGAKTCAAVATGDYAIGISFAYAGVKLANNGSPIEVILPKEGLGWEMEATAVVKGAAHLQAAQAVADFSASAQANALYNNYYQILARSDVAVTLPDNYPSGEEDLLLSPNDFVAAALNRDTILAEWQKRYGAKTAPKS